MKRVATKTVTITLKGGRDSFKVIKLVEGKPVVQSKLTEMSIRQINDYTEEVYEGADLSFLTPEDKKYYNNMCLCSHIYTLPHYLPISF